MGISASQMEPAAKKVAPWLPDDIRKVATLATETTANRAKRGLHIYLPTSENQDHNNNESDDAVKSQEDRSATIISASHPERWPIELLSQASWIIFSGNLDDFNQGSPRNDTEAQKSNLPEERQGGFRQYPLDKIRQNYKVKKGGDFPYDHQLSQSNDWGNTKWTTRWGPSGQQQHPVIGVAALTPTEEPTATDHVIQWRPGHIVDYAQSV